MSAVAGDAGEQTLISISTDAVKRPRSVIIISESMASSKDASRCIRSDKRFRLLQRC